MNAAVAALLRHLIDYAGLFPPARLPLEQAVRNFATYVRSADAWMLGRFICPASRLVELAPDQTLSLSVLGRGGDSPATFHAGLLADREAIRVCRETHGERVAIDVFETRLPLGHDFDELLRGLPMEPASYFELPLSPAWRQEVPAACRALRDSAAAGFKLRCGGLEAAAFPDVEQVAFVLQTCRHEGVRLKLTAGLHHPMRHHDAGIGVTMHGFVNVLTACLLTEQDADETTVCAALAEEDPTAFRFDDHGLCWGGRLFSPADIGEARAERLVSLGSCSFDEPREDLRTLGWLR